MSIEFWAWWNFAWMVLYMVLALYYQSKYYAALTKDKGEEQGAE